MPVTTVVASRGRVFMRSGGLPAEFMELSGIRARI